jgi:hypothetical protein
MRKHLETTNLIAALRTALAGELAKSEPDQLVVNDALRGLFRWEYMPGLEAKLEAMYKATQPDRVAIEALTSEIRDLHSGHISDHVRDALLASVAEPVAEPTAEPQA